MDNIIEKLAKELAGIAEEMCDRYCKFPDEYTNEEIMIREECDHCPLMKLL